MRRAIARFWAETTAQDTIEFTLLLAFVVLSSAALYLHNAKAISAVWGVTSNNLELAKSAVS
jgi:Flp pilus assembly pilin Flp